MNKIEVPWRCWYGNDKLELSFPERWNVNIYKMKDRPSISDEEIERTFFEPIGTECLSRLAKGKKSAVILVDDLSRPTQAYRIMPYLINQLREGGLGNTKISILMAIGAHRAMVRNDLIKKLGEKILRSFAVYNHFPYENIVDLGTSTRGIPIKINKVFMEADLKIAVGFLMPHPMTCFGGGAKIIAPGIAGIETLEQTHRPALLGISKRISSLEGNQIRADIEEIAKKAGLEFIVNAVGNSEGGIAGLFVGNPFEAYQEGINFAQEVYSTASPAENVDIGIFNAYPCDTEFIQASKGFNILREGYEDIVREEGAMVLIAASSEGRGVHYLGDKGMRLYQKLDVNPRMKRIFRNRRQIIFSPNITYADVLDYFPENTLLFEKWEKVIKELAKSYQSDSRVAVFPCSSLQIFR